MSAPTPTVTLCTNCGESDDGVAGWVLGVLGTLAVVAVLGCLVALLFFYRKYKTAGERVWKTEKEEEKWVPLLCAEGPLDNHPGDRITNNLFLLSKDRDKLRKLMKNHSSNNANPNSLPGGYPTYPRGPGRTPLSIPGSEVASTVQLLSSHHAQIWYTKRSGILEELKQNLKIPTRLKTKQQELISEAAISLNEVHPTTNPDTGPLQNLIIHISTQEGSDTDRMLLHDDAPVWVGGNKMGEMGWEGYAPRNATFHKETDEHAEGILETNRFGDKETGYKTAAKWVKTNSILSILASNRRHSPKTLYKAVRNSNGHHFLAQTKNFLVWLTPISCTTNYRSALHFLESADSTSLDNPKQNVLYKFFNVSYWYPVETLSQYKWEESVLVPMLTPFSIEAVRQTAEGITVVDLQYGGGSHVKDELKRLRSDVMEDAWSAEESISRTWQAVEKAGNKPNPPRKRGEINNDPALNRLDRSGCIKEVKEFDPGDTTRCHECGGLAHGLHSKAKKQLEAILNGEQQGRNVRTVPEQLYIAVGGPIGGSEITGLYTRREESFTWCLGDKMLRHINERWALTSTDHPMHAFLVSIEATDPGTLPHTLSRWSRPVNGKWNEDPSIRVTLQMPMEWDFRALDDYGEEDCISLPSGNPLLQE